MELGFGSSLLVRFQAGRCPEIDNVVTAALLPHRPDQLRRRHDRYDNGERATPLYGPATQWNQCLRKKKATCARVKTMSACTSILDIDQHTFNAAAAR